MSTHTTQELLTLKEVAALTKIKIPTWRRAIAQRRIPFVRIGRSIRVPIEVVREIISSGWQDPIDLKEKRGSP